MKQETDMNEEATNVPSGQRMFSCPNCGASHRVEAEVILTPDAETDEQPDA